MTIHSKLRDFGLFDARVPRYTSYPTAPHFSNAVSPQQVEEWVGSIKPNSQISLYLHVPFCRRLCWFCACRTQGTSTLSPVNAYVETLKSEVATISRLLPAGVTVEHLHWGGGTPTLLPAETIKSLSDKVFEHFELSDGAQFSVEIDPNELDDERLDALVEAGMNRASIGVQDFDEIIQETIGREQSFETTRKAVDAIRSRGIQSLNMDILFGLPYQNGKRITDSVSKVLSLSPDRVALYGYAHVPWMAKRQSLIPTESLPTPQERLDLFETARQLFVADGYAEIGIDHFARPEDGLATALRAGTLRRNFQGYTEDTAETLIGLGASAISRYPQGYAQNNPATSAYQKAVRAGELATARGHVFSDEDLLRGRIIEKIMCDFEFDIEDVAQETGAEIATLTKISQEVADQFEDMVDFSEGRFFIPNHARPLTRMIAKAFDSYAMSQSGHSTAI